MCVRVVNFVISMVSQGSDPEVLASCWGNIQLAIPSLVTPRVGSALLLELRESCFCKRNSGKILTNTLPVLEDTESLRVGITALSQSLPGLRNGKQPPSQRNLCSGPSSAAYVRGLITVLIYSK